MIINMLVSYHAVTYYKIAVIKLVVCERIPQFLEISSIQDVYYTMLFFIMTRVHNEKTLAKMSETTCIQLISL